jgi:hypothetical protein
MKQCKTCGELKSLDEYTNSKNNAGGKKPNCKACSKASVNKKIQNAASKRYRDRYPEKRLKQNKIYRDKNREKMSKINTDYSNMRYRTDSVYRLQTILRQQIVDYLKHKKNERTSQLLGYTAQDFINCYGEGAPGQHIDHKIPKSWFKDDAPINVVWHIDNLHWLAKEENSSKYNRYMHSVSESYLQIALPHIKDNFVDNCKNTPT